MANNLLFTGEHSTLLINMNHVVYAKSEGPHGGKLTIFMVNGIELELDEGNADMFRKQWRDCTKHLTQEGFYKLVEQEVE